jgi:hypothetical protein
MVPSDAHMTLKQIYGQSEPLNEKCPKSDSHIYNIWTQSIYSKVLRTQASRNFRAASKMSLDSSLVARHTIGARNRGCHCHCGQHTMNSNNHRAIGAKDKHHGDQYELCNIQGTTFKKLKSDHTAPPAMIHLPRGLYNTEWDFSIPWDFLSSLSHQAYHPHSSCVDSL